MGVVTASGVYAYVLADQPTLPPPQRSGAVQSLRALTIRHLQKVSNVM